MIKDSKQLDQLTTYLTYDDVLLLPNYSDVAPVDTDPSSQMADIPLPTPLLAAPMDTVTEVRLAIRLAQLGGLGFIHRNLSIEDQAEMVFQVCAKKLPVIGAVGVGPDLEERVEALVKAGATGICVDSAHGYTKNVIETTALIRKKFPDIVLISGNVATYDGAKALFEAGADALRVGMGPGSICTTRIMSGMGVPQLSAVVETVRAANELNKHIIADGGIRTSGDIVKALAAGADSVMAGSLLAGTDEAPGDVVEISGRLYKSYRGMGSVGAMKEGSAARYGQKFEEGQTKKLVPEGVEGLVKHTGTLEDLVHQLMGGVRAGMGYLGASNLAELRDKAQFVRISPAGLAESKPHDIVVK